MVLVKGGPHPLARLFGSGAFLRTGESCGKPSGSTTAELSASADSAD